MRGRLDDRSVDPASDPPSETTPPATAGSEDPAGGAESAPEAPTVLLVEDNPENRDIYTTILRHRGFRVVATASGEEALGMARRDGPAVILLDISIPGIDGWTVARRLKQAEETRAIPIVALTAHALPEHRERAREVGCDGYLAKPVDPLEVVEEVRRFVVSEG